MAISNPDWQAKPNYRAYKMAKPYKITKSHKMAKSSKAIKSYKMARYIKRCTEIYMDANSDKSERSSDRTRASTIEQLLLTTNP
jgi:hypothetical protein